MTVCVCINVIRRVLHTHRQLKREREESESMLPAAAAAVGVFAVCGRLLNQPAVSVQPLSSGKQ